MKIAASSKSHAIRHEGELEFHFREFLRDDPDLRWTLTHEKTDRGSGRDLVELHLDSKRIAFRPVYELRPGSPALETVAASPPSPRPLLVTPSLSARLVAACRERGLAAIDLNGRTYLRAPGLLVDRQALAGRAFRCDLEPRNIFTGKSARIVRCLLTDRDHTWTQAELGTRTGASPGLVSRIVHHLISQGFLEKVGTRAIRLRDWTALLDEWAASDRFEKRTLTAQYAGFFGPPQDLAHRLQQWADASSIPLAFTQWIAAWTRHPWTEPPLCSAYIDHFPDAAALEQLGLRQVTDGGKLQLHVPDDAGILTETRRQGGLTLVTDAQIHLDLQRTGLRGPDAAAALREWEGFCRP